ncbi:MAG: LLM class flavin-dependent oxidoreductase [Ilumatobacteraceae bacterium]
MRTAITLADFVRDDAPDFTAAAAHVVAAERLGVDTVWSAEAWGTDGVVPLAYLAGVTTRIRLATGALQITARSASMTAMTAMTLDRVSGGRFVLGLGVSGPQVVEGLHGVEYARPLERLRETVDVLRLAFAGERLEYRGNQIVLPRPGGQGKALRIGQPPRPDLPIFVAALGPQSLRFVGAQADGWVSTCFVPERAGYYLAHLRDGAAAAGRSLDAVAIDAGGPVAFTDDPEGPLRGRKKALAFQLSAMGSPTTNFYHDAYARLGYAEPAHRVRDLWLAGDRRGAVEAVPDELAILTSMVGDDAMVRDRIRAYRDAGVTDLRLQPMGRTPTEQLDTLARVVDLVRQVDAEPIGQEPPAG